MFIQGQADIRMRLCLERLLIRWPCPGNLQAVRRHVDLRGTLPGHLSSISVAVYTVIHVRRHQVMAN